MVAHDERQVDVVITYQNGGIGRVDVEWRVDAVGDGDGVGDGSIRHQRWLK